MTRGTNPRTISRLLAPLEPVLAEYQCRVTGTTRKRNHLKVSITGPSGGTRLLVIGISTSDYRAEKNMVAIARRICRDLNDATAGA